MIFQLLFLLLAISEKPPTVSKDLAAYLGEYGTGQHRLIVRESKGILEVQADAKSAPIALRKDENDRFVGGGKSWIFRRNSTGHINGLEAGKLYPRKSDFPEDGAVFRIHPLRPVETLRAEAVRQTPPTESGSFRKADLVDLETLRFPPHLDIRYATSNNFMGAPMYTQARAFLQRPAAEALSRAADDLRQKGFGLLIHDAYRPWYVTWMFWEATPVKQRIFVANPKEGSRHNRGCAVDLSMYELSTGKPVSMPSVYDEMTGRAYPDYPGGPSLQRWYRSVLRHAMERQGFVVNKAEWWHFDFRDWQQYPIGTAKFEDLRGAAKTN